jgi:hypothetical protein
MEPRFELEHMGLELKQRLWLELKHMGLGLGLKQ